MFSVSSRFLLQCRKVALSRHAYIALSKMGVTQSKGSYDIAGTDASKSERQTDCFVCCVINFEVFKKVLLNLKD